jgi:hypothetical protein
LQQRPSFLVARKSCGFIEEESMAGHAGNGGNGICRERCGKVQQREGRQGEAAEKKLQQREKKIEIKRK